MNKTILITGATDGIGLATARMLVEQGHRVLLHGRNQTKLDAVAADLAELPGGSAAERYMADLSSLDDVEALAATVSEHHPHLDVLINNAGVFKVADTTTESGLDVRFVVNTVAPYLLTRRLLSRMDSASRVINLSSAAQAPVDLDALAGHGGPLDDFAAYAQSKLALTMWTRHMADELGRAGPTVIAVNPGSLLATKMVKQGFGTAGNDIRIGAGILVRAALDADFAETTGLYFDNDKGRFGDPHPDAGDPEKSMAVVRAIDAVVGRTTA